MFDGMRSRTARVERRMIVAQAGERAISDSLSFLAPCALAGRDRAGLACHY